ncbi:MAG TPA: DUF3048 domain-containing protein [Jatrophihabitans sp.]|nr:DUF3048 domain-containing protein [Jatrophihabitans sp.]
MIRSRYALLAALAAATALVSAACGGGGGSAPTTTPTPTLPNPQAKNPFTGVGTVPTTPTIAVKIDDTAPGRPQVGIDRADIVYIEAVEGGLTRLVAVYGTYKPTHVGYVRSTRPSDPELLLQYGKITEAYSGGAHDSIPLLNKSGITSWSQDSGKPYYHRVSRSESSYINVVLNVSKVAKKVKTPGPKNIGWTFDSSLGGLQSKPAKRLRTVVTGANSGGTDVEFRYSARLHKYVRYIDGAAQHAADGKAVAATNVIVQQCRVVAHPQDTDVNGNPSQYTYTVGSGKVSVFRGGRRIDGEWQRAKPEDGTQLQTSGGDQIPLAPGNTWVVLIRKGVPLHS